MKYFSKNPLKLIAAAAFMVALGYGVATNSKVSELSSFVNLSALSSVSAQGENEECPNGCLDDCGWCFCYQFYYLTDVTHLRILIPIGCHA